MGCVESSSKHAQVEQVVSHNRTNSATPPAQQQLQNALQEAYVQGIEFDEVYFVGKKLGEGSFGQVRKAENRRTGNAVAVKILDIQKRSSSKTVTSKEGTAFRRGSRSSLDLPMAGFRQSSTSRSQRSILTARGSQRAGVNESQRRDPMRRFHRAVQAEVYHLKLIGKHRNCIQLMEFYMEEDKCYIVTELCTGTLLEYLDHSPLSNVQDLQRVLKEMVLAVEYIHEVGVMHRDIKPDNFLVGGEGNKTIKLADFGAAALCPKNGHYLKNVFGTAPYMSPEMIEEGGYDQGTDIWSLGATYYVLLYGEFPYQPREKTPGKMKSAIYHGVPPPRYEQVPGKQGVVQGIPEVAEDLVRQCLTREWDVRPTAPEVSAHDFLKDVKVQDDLEAPGDRQPSKSMQGTEGSWPKSDASTDIPGAQVRTAVSSENDQTSRQSSRKNSKQRPPN